MKWQRVEKERAFPKEKSCNLWLTLSVTIQGKKSGEEKTNLRNIDMMVR